MVSSFSRLLALMSALVGGVRVVLVVVPAAAAGLTIAGAGAVTVGALAVPVCETAVARCLVHSSYCTRLRARVSTCVDARVGWLVVPRAGRVFVGDRVGWWRAWCFVGAG